MRTAFYDRHTRMHRHFRMEYLDRPSWVQLIHGSNQVMARSRERVAQRAELLDLDADRFLADVVAGVPVGFPPG